MAKSETIRDRVKDLRRVKASELRPSPFNWRTHPAAQMDALRGILSEIGFAGASLARELPGGELELIDGHARAEISGDDIIPVLVLDVDEAEAKKILATFDPLGAMAEADSAKLDALLRDVQTGSEALAGMLTKLAEDNGVVNLPAEGAGGDDFDATPEETGPTRTQSGDLWVIGGKHRLLVGDCTVKENVERLMGGEWAAGVFTSPPYNQRLGTQSAPTGMHKTNAWFKRLDSAYHDNRPEEEYQAWQVALLALWHDHVRDGGVCFYNHKHRYRDRRPIIPLDWIRQTPWHLRQEIIWDRRGGVAANAGMFIPGDERVYWLEKDGEHVWNGVGNNRTTVWPISPQQNDGEHVCPYPLELVTIPVEATTNAGDLIADPFLGSGTTLIAAHRLNRTCYGMEIEPRFADVILKRAEAEGLTCEKVR